MLKFLLLTSLTSFASPQNFTREALLKGSPVPTIRKFPLSQKVKPCEDFHRYVCEEVEKNFKLPADRAAWTFSFTDSSERILHAKKNYFKMLAAGAEPVTERAKPLKNYYLACMKPAARKKDELKLVKDEIAAITKIQTREELLKLLRERMTQPEMTVVHFGTIANQDDPSREDLYFLSEMMTLPEISYYEKKENVEDVRKLAELFFKTLKIDQPEKRAQWVADFETQFSKHYPSPAEFRQRVSARTYMPQKDWVSKYPQFLLGDFFGQFPKDIQVRNFAPETMAWMNEALEKTPLEELKSVLLFQGLKDDMDEAYPKFFAANFEFQRKHLGGPAKRPPRDERCTKAVMGAFSMELDQELISILFPNFPQDKVTALAEKVRASIQRGLDHNTWLSRDARKEAKLKVEKAKLHLVKPQKDADWDFLPILSFDPNHPLENAKKLAQAKIDKEIKEANEKRNPDRWAMGPMTINAYYSPADNKFVLLQGILQPPFYDAAAPESQNLGSIGAVVGHELGHGIDDQGSKYDSTGKLRQWMSMKDLAEFSKRGEKFIAQFDKIGHNGRLTLGENIGDHVGLTFAFDAAFPDPAQATAEEKKNFFISYGRAWCQVMRPEHAQMRLKTDPHSLGPERINQQVIHNDAFQEVFACQPTDKMFLEKEQRIRVW